MENNQIQKHNLRTWIEISHQALKNNYDIFRGLIGPKCFLMAVVKSNAYGHSLLDFSREIENLGVDWLGVDSIIEAEKLRKIGLKKPILVLGYTLQNKVAEAVKNNISLTIADIVALKKLKTLRLNKNKLKIHLKIDTGMHRHGFLLSEIPGVITFLKTLNSSVKLEGAYTHFSSAGDLKNPEKTKKQIKEFEKAIKLLELAGFKNLIKHAANTAGTIVFPEGHFDLVRVGIGLYGLWPAPETQKAYQKKIKLQPVLAWKTIIDSIKNLPPNSKIGYDLTEKINYPSKIAVLPIGYWHGFSRSLSSIGKVLIRGQIAKVIGRVSMDMISVDATHIKNIKVGDEAYLIGKNGRLEITADELARLSKTINYEIVTCLNPLIKKIIVK